MPISTDVFGGRQNRIMNLIARWPPEEVAKYSQLFEDYTSGKIETFEELQEAIREARQPKHSGASPRPVVWAGKESHVSQWGR